ncbi:MAG: helix-turn-helix transcriptional regulator [Bacteroidales bacterium]|jgi:predicted XRE-type DNA-binding protein|nr:helix-turn-helix transcriptional regulator [Bacteroidales bacterium]MBR4137953.1 helix-turn-helix transcriptional regulator [Bacteroidales bacterium]
MSTSSLFREELAKIPTDVRKQVDMSWAIADKIDALLKNRGMSHKEFARLMGKTEPEVSRWVGGTHNFTIRTLAKISVVLGEDLITI